MLNEQELAVIKAKVQRMNGGLPYMQMISVMTELATTIVAALLTHVTEQENEIKRLHDTIDALHEAIDYAEHAPTNSDFL